MIIIQVAGGLGNQMQQYALYRKLAECGKEVRLDLSWFTEKSRQEGVYAKRELELMRFCNLSLNVCTDEEKRMLLGDNNILAKVMRKLQPGRRKIFNETQMYHPEIYQLDEQYLCGYWACEKYYYDIMDKLRNELSFPESGNSKNWETAEEMQKEKSVCIHIRRGDYLDAENEQMFGNICTEEYYNSALRVIQEKVTNPRFYLFSDDVNYVKEKYCGEEFTVIDWNKGSESIFDMWLMSKCKHQICANSTFSFWGARLNPNPEKIMIRPSIHKNTQIFEKDKMYDYWKSWVFIDNKGEVV